MSTDRSQLGTIIFDCDEKACDESIDTGRKMWEYGKEVVKREGWYIVHDDDFPTNRGWLHLCPKHGKARWIAKKRLEEQKQ